ncbi:MAG TPA: hypothetical protein VIL20_22070 [Sandaracinaceae bacterium]
MQRSAVLFGTMVALALAAPASAQTVAPGGPVEAPFTSTPFPDTMETARGMAMGLGARASATSTSGLAYNAAGLSIGRLYHVETAIGYEPGSGRLQFGGSVIDSYSGPVNAGVNFRYVHGNGHGGHGGYDGRIALGIPIGEAFALGVTGRYVSFWREGQEGAPPWTEGISLDASIRVTPVPGLHLAALGYNLIPLPSPLTPMQVGGSASYTIDNRVTIAFDGLADLSSWTNEDGSIRPEALLAGGLEYFTGEVPIRAGYVYDTGRNAHYLTAGVGWVNQQVGIEIAWRQQLTHEYHAWLLATFRYFVH